MTAGNGRFAQKVIAIIVIVALLDVVGVSAPIIVFFVAVGFLVWHATQRSEHRETERIFSFYKSADEILREKTRHWYGFEIAEVINEGEAVFHSLPDPPPLIGFALGGLYYSIGNYDAAIKRLAPIVEDESAEEWQRSAPSQQLRRYVERLRKIEREPVLAPQTMAAIRNLERVRQKAAAQLLADSRQRLRADAGSNAKQSFSTPVPVPATADNHAPPPLNTITPPRPICDVLHDVYRDEKTA